MLIARYFSMGDDDKSQMIAKMRYITEGIVNISETLVNIHRYAKLRRKFLHESLRMPVIEKAHIRDVIGILIQQYLSSE